MNSKKMPKIFSVFCHKGGVGKTTFVQNIVYALAERKKDLKILLIDADPQMNLTACVHGLSESVEYSMDQESKWKDIINKHADLAEYFNASLASKPYDKKCFQKEKWGNVFLMGGSISLALTEFRLHDAFNSRDDYTGAVERVLQSYKELVSPYDCVFIDTSPSASSIVNALFVTTASYFLIPVMPTFFARQALDNMEFIIRSWAETLYFQKERIEKNLWKARSQLLGLVVQIAKRFSREDRIDQKFSNQTSDWIDKANKETITPLQGSLGDIGRAISTDQFTNSFPGRTPFVLEEFIDFTPMLRSCADQLGVPVLALEHHKDKEVYFNKRKYTVEGVLRTKQYKKSFEMTKESYAAISAGILKCMDTSSD